MFFFYFSVYLDIAPYAFQTSTHPSYNDEVKIDQVALIGTSKERSVVAKKTEEAYEVSLRQDQEKERLKQETEAENLRLSNLMNSRKDRVQPEESVSNPHEVVTVRHVDLGNKVRLFKTDSYFVEVFDWVGSFAPTPEYFKLLDYGGKEVSPGMKIVSGIYNMSPSQTPVVMSPEVAFLGFSTANQSISDDPSVILNEESQNVSTNQEDDLRTEYQTMQRMKKEERDRLNPEVQIVVVSRESIYNDMIKLYSKRQVLKNILAFTFMGEEAVGDGVSRDAYSAFYKELYAKMDGYTQRVPTSNFDEEELTVIGKIIYHGYILYDVFPIELSKISLKYALFEQCEKSELITSFLHFITPVEEKTIKSFLEGSFHDKQPILDIFSDYAVFTLPSRENLSDLLEKASRIALIRSPFFAMQAMTKGFGTFFNKLEPKMIDALYHCTTPTADLVIKNLESNEVCNMDQKITTWVHRYIRNCTRSELSQFLRFITGSSTFTENTVIKLEFVNQNLAYLRPVSKTCFKILILPRQYSCFTQLRENLNFCINNADNWTVHDSIDFISL